jgi:hypothetical protein
VPEIWKAWRSGVYVGDTKPSTRVTVEESYWLNMTGPVVGQWSRGPARWFQRADLSKQIETEIPGVVSINIQRSVEPDAGTCDLTIRNVTPPVLGAAEQPPGEFAQIGYYTPERGESQEGAARWGHAINPWHGVIVPNALLRTYQGFGGEDKSIRDAVADGNLVLNGVWLVDDLTITTDGTINIKCRDMMKLLIDQQLVPPLVPSELYPLQYQRWRYESFAITDGAPGTGSVCQQTHYPDPPGLYSSTDHTYGTWNAPNTGHPPSDAFDISYENPPGSGWDLVGKFAHQKTFWLSEPKGDPGDSVWIEMHVDDATMINEIYCHPWRGSLEGKGTNVVMVSIMEYGEWANEVDFGYANPGLTPQGIPYVTWFVPGVESVPGEHKTGHRLPRDYKATRVRLTWTNLIWADDHVENVIGGFRAGARKLMACFNREWTMYPRLVYTGVSIPANDKLRNGYWQVRSNGEVFAFGDARVYPPQGGMTHVGTVVGMCAHPSGEGYWTIDNAGRIVAAGAAQWYGDPIYNLAGGRFADIACTHTGKGYWALRWDGTIFSFGDAQNLGNSSHVGTMPDGVQARAQAIDSHPTKQGFWVLWQDGHVDAHNVTFLGHANRVGFTGLDWTTSLKRSSTGNGYWILSGGGIVQAFGDAQHKGNAPPSTYDEPNWFRGLTFEFLTSPEGNDGYMLQRLDGNLAGLGNYKFFGSIGSGSGELRHEGNYKDYTDIVKELLLWSGFYFFRDPQPQGLMPDVYGNMESTGAYSTNDPLPPEMFDKRPVLDAIKDIKAIVGYAFYIDAEGAARWEAPNWWQMGNFLIDGRPFAYMPEIDEVVQLTTHSVVRSAQAARSEIIIATEYPYSTVAGQKVSDSIVKTRIVGSTAPDLKGIVSPAIWHNGEFLKKEEQQTMAEILDMQIWFNRRTANIQCVANPLIDVNDQIRVIERQTGDVYVHYIKAINFSHDIANGKFSMSLTTHWLGGTPFGQLRLFQACAARPQGDGYWQISVSGDVYAYGAAELKPRHEADSHISWPIGMRSTNSGNGYWTLDQHGKVLSYGDAVHYGDLDRPTKDVADFAITPSGHGYWILLTNGEVHTFGDAVFHGNGTPAGILPPGVAVRARSIESHPSTVGYWILLTDGTVTAHNLTHHGNATRTGYTDTDFATRLHATSSGAGYWITSGRGVVQARGDAPFRGNGIAYPDDRANLGFIWDFLTSPSDGYALQHADGTFDRFDMPELGASPTAATLNWALVTADTHQALGSPTSAYPVSTRLMEFLQNTGSPSANNAVANRFTAPSPAALEGTVV